ncbi:DUF1127 domain-containing protein [Pseudomonas alkylphenolica]|nr:DUF1127 domain-containing protein [Pseudomonas alkylphenolica]MBH3430243.1 DUF1127 domain-containing protein [Pseudomonas alkylphenolica]
MYGIRNIRWIDLRPALTLSSSHTEGKTMKGQKSLVLMHSPSHHGGLSHLFHDVVGQLARWRQLHYQRMELARLSDAALHDIGMSRADVMQEVERPFWDDPLKK